MFTCLALNRSSLLHQVMTYVGAWFNGLTLLILGKYILSFVFCIASLIFCIVFHLLSQAASNSSRSLKNCFASNLSKLNKSRVVVSLILLYP